MLLQHCDHLKTRSQKEKNCIQKAKKDLSDLVVLNLKSDFFPKSKMMILHYFLIFQYVLVVFIR